MLWPIRCGMGSSQASDGRVGISRETLLRKHRKIRLLALASGRILGSGGTEGRGDAAARKLFAGRVRRQEEADAARQVSGRDGVCGAVGAAGCSSSAILSEG